MKRIIEIAGEGWSGWFFAGVVKYDRAGLYLSLSWNEKQPGASWEKLQRTEFLSFSSFTD